MGSISLKLDDVVYLHERDGDGHTDDFFLFNKRQYITVNAEKVKFKKDVSTDRSIVANKWYLPGGWKGSIDAALYYSDTSDKSYILFRGGEYVRLDKDAPLSRQFANHDIKPLEITLHWGLPYSWRDGIDAATYVKEDKGLFSTDKKYFYLFKKSQYIKIEANDFDQKEKDYEKYLKDSSQENWKDITWPERDEDDRDEEYRSSLPKDIKNKWPGLPQEWTSGIDAVTYLEDVDGFEGIFYFFKGKYFTKLDEKGCPIGGDHSEEPENAECGTVAVISLIEDVFRVPLSWIHPKYRFDFSFINYEQDAMDSIPVQPEKDAADKFVEIDNCASSNGVDVTQTVELSTQEDFQESVSFEKALSVELASSVTVTNSASIGLDGVASAGVDVAISAGISVTTGITEQKDFSTTKSRLFSDSAEVTVPAGKCARFMLNTASSKSDVSYEFRAFSQLRVTDPFDGAQVFDESILNEIANSFEEKYEDTEVADGRIEFQVKGTFKARSYDAKAQLKTVECFCKNASPVIITSGGIYEGTPANDTFYIYASRAEVPDGSTLYVQNTEKLKDIVIFSDDGYDKFIVYPSDGGININILDFDYEKDKIEYLGKCPTTDDVE